MRHLKKGKKFHRLTGPRRAFLRNLTKDLIRHGRIETTETRAKAIRPIVERMITFAKRENLTSRRVLISRLQDKAVVKKLIEDVAPRYRERHGGYVRIVKSGKNRKRDGARVAVIEFV